MPSPSFSVSVPASSANLGPGFDAIGIALDLRVRALVEPASRFSLRFSGPHQPTHFGFERMLLAAMHAIGAELPRVRVQLHNAIPLGKGLGSSAAARTLGVAIAARAHGLELSRDELARYVCDLEGHPDNALPAVYGGIAIATSAHPHENLKLRAPHDLRAVVVVPAFELATAHARAILPPHYSRTDCVFNVQRAALLGAALASGSWDLLRHAMRDRMHQPHRAAIVPGLADALAVDERGLVGIALSGAGPSVLALVRADTPWRPIAASIEACFAQAGIAARSYELAFASRGIITRRYLTERKAA